VVNTQKYRTEQKCRYKQQQTTKKSEQEQKEAAAQHNTHNSNKQA
jgi:hypothetical protein